jgi:hypothetical protein
MALRLSDQSYPGILLAACPRAISGRSPNCRLPLTCHAQVTQHPIDPARFARPRRRVRGLRLHIGEHAGAPGAVRAAERRARRRHRLLGLVDFAAGVVVLAWPVPTALVLVLVVASWAGITGALEIVAAFRGGEEVGPVRCSSLAAS